MYAYLFFSLNGHRIPRFFVLRISPVLVILGPNIRWALMPNHTRILVVDVLQDHETTANRIHTFPSKDLVAPLTWHLQLFLPFPAVEKLDMR